MSTWSQWFTSYQKKPAAKQITWVCGSETVLVDEVVTALQSHFPDKVWSRVSYTAGADAERDIWADLDQYSIDGRQPRLVVVRNAEKLKSLHRIAEWVQNKNQTPLTHVCFVSNENELAREEQTKEQKRDRKRAELVPHLRAIQGKGSLIECKPFTQATAKHAVTWVQTKIDVPKGVAGKLLERANGDLRLTRDAFTKLSMFPDEITEHTINLLLSARPRLSFVDAMLEINKPAALLALDYVNPKEYSAIIGLLDQRLEVIGKVRDLVVVRASQAQISAALGTMGFLAPDLIPLAKSYDRKRRTHLRQLLAKTDEYLRLGQTRGPLEALVTLW